MAQLAEKLVLYKRHQAAVLDYWHRFLAAFTVKDITRWSRATRQVTLKLLNNVLKYYGTECNQKARNQSTIYNWIHSHTVLQSGHVIGSGLEDTWITGQRPTQSVTNYNSNASEVEFEWDPST